MMFIYFLKNWVLQVFLPNNISLIISRFPDIRWLGHYFSSLTEEFTGNIRLHMSNLLKDLCNPLWSHHHPISPVKQQFSSKLRLVWKDLPNEPNKVRLHNKSVFNFSQ